MANPLFTQFEYNHQLRTSEFEFLVFDEKLYKVDSYSSSNSRVLVPMFFKNSEDLTKWIGEDINKRSKTKVISISPVKVEAKISVSLTIEGKEVTKDEGDGLDF